MALKKKIELETGIEADYWRISKVLIVGMQSATAYVELFKDEGSRRGSKQPVLRDEFTWAGEDNPFTADGIERGVNPMKICYAKLKEGDKFKGAEDV